MVSATRVAAVRRGCAAALLAVLVTGPVLVLGPSGAAGADDPAEDALVLSTPTLSPDRTLSVVATVPSAMTGDPLPAGAFTATQDAATVPLIAERVLGRPAELLLVLDATGDAGALAAEQGAAADLLRALPGDLPTTVLPGGAPTTARDALAAVGALRPRPGLLLDGMPAAADRRRLAVVLAGCDALRAEVRRPAGEDLEVSVLATGGCDAAAVRLAGSSPGVVRTGLAPGALVGATDGVTRRLLGEYVLSAGPGLSDGPLQVTVRSGAAVSSAGVPVPTAAPATRPGGRRTAVVVAAALAAVAALGLLGDLAVRRRYRAA